MYINPVVKVADFLPVVTFFVVILCAEDHGTIGTVSFTLDMEDYYRIKDKEKSRDDSN